MHNHHDKARNYGKTLLTKDERERHVPWYRGEKYALRGAGIRKRIADRIAKRHSLTLEQRQQKNANRKTVWLGNAKARAAKRAQRRDHYLSQNHITH